MTLHAVVLFLHVLAASVLLGSSLLAPLARAAIRRATTLGALRPWLSFAHDSTRANPVAAMVLLGTGLYLARGRWDEAWLPVSTVLFVVSSLLAVKVVGALGERIAALARPGGDGPVGPEIDALRRSVAWELAGEILVANDLAAFFLMCVQPGLVGAVAAVVVPNVAVALLRTIRRGAPAPTAHPQGS